MEQLGITSTLGRGEASVASAATVNLGALRTRDVVITGTTAITSFGTVANRDFRLRFVSAITLTHNATSLILPAGVNIVTAAGDIAIVESDISGNWRLTGYQPAVVAVGNSGAIAYTPTVAALSGTITTVGATSAFYTRITPKLLYLTIDVTITTNGTGAGSVNVSLPFTAANRYATLMGLELALNNKALNGQIIAGGGNCNIRYYDATYPGANGARLQVNGLYEVA